jgi:hypothetical protein
MEALRIERLDHLGVIASVIKDLGLIKRLSGNKAFITEHFRSYAGQG